VVNCPELRFEARDRSFAIERLDLATFERSSSANSFGSPSVRDLLGDLLKNGIEQTLRHHSPLMRGESQGVLQ